MEKKFSPKSGYNLFSHSVWNLSLDAQWFLAIQPINTNVLHHIILYISIENNL